MAVAFYYIGTDEERVEDSHHSVYQSGLLFVVIALNTIFLVFNVLIMLATGHLIVFHIYLQKKSLSTYGFIKKKREEKANKPLKSKTVVKIVQDHTDEPEVTGPKTAQVTPPEDVNSQEEFKEQSHGPNETSPKQETDPPTPEKPQKPKKKNHWSTWLLCCR